MHASLKTTYLLNLPRDISLFSCWLFELFIDSIDLILSLMVGELKMSLRINVYGIDPSLLKLLTLILEKKGHQVQVFTDSYSCPSCIHETCIYPLGTTCADAIIINTRKPVLETLPILKAQDEKGCKLTKQKKVIMSSFFTDKQKQAIQSMGYTTIKKPFAMSKIADWLESCESSLND